MADREPTAKRHAAHVAEDGHYSETVVTVTPKAGQDIDGSVTLTICQTCHYITAHCDHVANRWNGNRLGCRLCGIDGT